MAQPGPGQQGGTLAELLVAMVVALMALTLGVAYSLPGLAREGMRGAVYEAQTCLRLARVEAVTRNRDCRCVIDTASGVLQALDTLGTSSPSDDRPLHESRLPSTVVIGRPDSGAGITLAQIGMTTSYEAVFSSDGAVALGQGSIHLFGGDRYGRVSVFGIGAVQVERWDGSAWVPGS
jgi:Tfp pilus assembly protein FimT